MDALSGLGFEAAQVIGTDWRPMNAGSAAATWSAAYSTTIIPPALAWCRVPHSGGSPGVTRRPRIHALKRRTSMTEASIASNADPAGITLLQNLAQRVLAFDKRQLTKKAIAQARACIIDTIGVTLGGHPEPCTQILLKTPGVATAPG